MNVEKTRWACPREFLTLDFTLSPLSLLFDAEALMFPVAAVFKKFNEVGAGGVVLLSILVFIAVLIQGIVYCWKKGDLDWVKFQCL